MKRQHNGVVPVHNNHLFSLLVTTQPNMVDQEHSTTTSQQICLEDGRYGPVVRSEPDSSTNVHNIPLSKANIFNLLNNYWCKRHLLNPITPNSAWVITKQ
jgi:hypothetical protein